MYSKAYSGICLEGGGASVPIGARKPTVNHRFYWFREGGGWVG